MRAPTVVAVLLTASSMTATASDTCLASSGKLRVPLVELYTSEGCSSCPPADRWLSGRMKAGDANWLAFHVDYWDEIGWPDRFASPAFTQRQRLRVEQAGGRIVYTPQVMVGNRVDAPWQSGSAFDSVLDDARGSAGAVLDLRVERNRNGLRATVGMRALPGAATDATVWLAQTVDAQSTQVKSGENRGATLRHDRVVRQLFGAWPLSAEPTQRLQDLASIPTGAWGLVAFVQDSRGNTLQSLGLDVDLCQEIVAPP